MRLQRALLVKSRFADAAFERLFIRMSEHVCIESRSECEFGWTQAALVSLLAGVTNEVALQIFCSCEGFVALVAAERLVLNAVVHHHVRFQLRRLFKSFSTVWNVAQVRLVTVVPQKVVDKIVAHSHLFVAAVALVGGVLDV